MKYQDLYESVSFSPQKQQIINGQTHWTWVFDNNPYSQDADWDSDNEPPTNPHYNPDLDFNVSNDNAVEICNALGYHLDISDGLYVDIKEFISRCDRYIKTNFNKIDPKIDSSSDQTTNDQYDMDVYKTVYDQRKAWFQRLDVQQILKRRFGDDNQSMQNHIEQKSKEQAREKSRKQVPTGPLIINVGRNQGYLKEKITQLRKLAYQGQLHGATRMIIG